MNYTYRCRVHGDSTVNHASNDHGTKRFCSRLDDRAPFGDETCNEPLQRVFEATPFQPCPGMYAAGG